MLPKILDILRIVSVSAAFFFGYLIGFKDGFNPDNVDQLTFTSQQAQQPLTPITSPTKVYSVNIIKPAT